MNKTSEEKSAPGYEAGTICRHRENGKLYVAGFGGATARVNGKIMQSFRALRDGKAFGPTRQFEPSELERQP